MRWSEMTIRWVLFLAAGWRPSWHECLPGMHYWTNGKRERAAGPVVLFIPGVGGPLLYIFLMRALVQARPGCRIIVLDATLERPVLSFAPHHSWDIVAASISQLLKYERAEGIEIVAHSLGTAWASKLLNFWQGDVTVDRLLLLDPLDRTHLVTNTFNTWHIMPAQLAWQYNHAFSLLDVCQCPEKYPTKVTVLISAKDVVTPTINHRRHFNALREHLGEGLQVVVDPAAPHGGFLIRSSSGALQDALASRGTPWPEVQNAMKTLVPFAGLHKTRVLWSYMVFALSPFLNRCAARHIN
eukprot:NODE_10475_length_1349_cov_2.743044.p1 GENE.NODE_10475_length_1349_cov_2.743044~~NODE_10475_length_1349_cov_2.743044.p1  ORF type:complete len:298 (+),score=62.37 NODE_10475_length_1349_cov_2.743044:220-1113(+)